MGEILRYCCRSGCSKPAAATLTYVYADQTVVIGALSAQVEPHSYDVCNDHAARLTAPRGWRVIRLAPAVEESPDDVGAMVDAVNERQSLNPPTSDVDRPVVSARREPGSRSVSRVFNVDEATPEPKLPAAEEAVSETRGHLRILQPPARRNPRD